MKQKLTLHLQSALQSIGLNKIVIDLERPSNLSFGDYATGIALKLSKQLKKNPMQIAEEIVKHLQKDELIEKVEVVKPGFINIWISKQYLLSQAEKFSDGIFDVKPFYFGENKKVMVEFAHPNTHKLFHIGHLRTTITGECIARLFEAIGNTIVRANYQGDVGLHIAKCLWEIKKEGIKLTEDKNLLEKVQFLGEAYTKGNKAYETDAKAKEEIIEINRQIYEQNDAIIPLWKKTRQWSLDYFDIIYKRLYTKFDRLFFESEFAPIAPQLVKEALEKGILEKSEGAIIFNGKKYGIDTRVFFNSLGFPTYEGKELGLAEKEFTEFGPIDKCIHVVSSEQTSFFKVTFKVEELLDEKKYKNKQLHLVYGWVRLKHGKMSSRSGFVVEGPWLIDEAKRKIIDTFHCTDEIAEKLSVASIKYSILKNTIQGEIVFDFDESISIEGNSAPYLIYTYVRTCSILSKDSSVSFTPPTQVNEEELLLFRMIHSYPEIVHSAAQKFSPNFIATYLYNLAQQYNLFYQKCPILKADKKTKQFRLLLTKTVGQIIKNGLYILGIETVEKM